MINWNKIYVMTVIDTSSTPRAGEKRTWGFFHEEATAIDAVQTNDGDMHEGCYDYAVIEEFNPGSLALVDKEIWLKWKSNTNLDGTEDQYEGVYELCDKPEWSEGICNWGLG